MWCREHIGNVGKVTECKERGLKMWSCPRALEKKTEHIKEVYIGEIRLFQLITETSMGNVLLGFFQNIRWALGNSHNNKI